MKGRHLGAAALACVAGLILSVWPSTVGAQEGKRRESGSVKVVGRVTANSGSTFKLETPRRGELQVQHDPATKWRNLTADALKVGARVGVIGTLEDKVVQAKVIGAPPQYRRKDRSRSHDGRRLILKGEVTAVGDSTFTLKTRRREVKITYNKDTQFRGGSAEGLKIGAKVGVLPVVPSGANKESLRQATNLTAKAIGFPKGPGERAARKAQRQPTARGAS